MVESAAERAAVAHLQTVMDLSERRACQIVGADRTMVPGIARAGHLRRSCARGRAVIIPFLSGLVPGLHTASFSFMAGVIPPMPMFGRWLLYVHSHRVACPFTSSMVLKMNCPSHS